VLAYALRAEGKLGEEAGDPPTADGERTSAVLAALLPAPIAPTADGAAEELAALGRTLNKVKPTEGLAKMVEEHLAKLKGKGAGLRWGEKAPHVRTLDFVADRVRRYRRVSEDTVKALKPLSAWYQSLEGATDDPYYWQQRTLYEFAQDKNASPRDLPVRWIASLLARPGRAGDMLDPAVAAQLGEAFEALRDVLATEPLQDALSKHDEQQGHQRGMWHERRTELIYTLARTARTAVRDGAPPVLPALGCALGDLAVRLSAGPARADPTDATRNTGFAMHPLLAIHAFDLAVLVHGPSDAERDRVLRLMRPTFDAMAKLDGWRAHAEPWVQSLWPHRAFPETLLALEAPLRVMGRRLGW
jgi:hypothetical protein